MGFLKNLFGASAPDSHSQPAPQNQPPEHPRIQAIRAMSPLELFEYAGMKDRVLEKTGSDQSPFTTASWNVIAKKVRPQMIEREKALIEKERLASLSDPSLVPGSPQDASATEAQAKYEEGLRLFSAHQSREAMEAFVDATEIDPNCVDAWVALARCFHTVDPEKNADQVMHCAEQAVRAEPDNPKARNMASVAYFTKGYIAREAQDWNDAVQWFKRANEIEPDNQQTLSAYRQCAEQASKLKA